MALVDASRQQVMPVTTRVWFAAMSAADMQAYWRSGEPRDKAGAYGIQGAAGAFIPWISGSYTGIMGLPVAETAALLAAAGWPVWRQS